jgi:hypothetical protein
MGTLGRIATGLFSAAVLAALGIAAGCFKTEPKPPPDEVAKPAPPPTSGYITAVVTSPGTIKGTVTYVGNKPSLPAVRCARDLDVCGKAKSNQTILLGPGGTLKNVIVSLTDIHAGKPMTTNQARLDIKQCAYVPRVQAVDVKSSVMVTSADLIPHDLGGSLGSRNVFNRIILGKSEIIDLYTPGMLTIGCDVHSGSGASATCETGVIGVMTNPYFAVTGDDGSFSISEIPPGTYSVQAWHETLGEQTQRVTVPPSGTVTADFKVAAKI